MFDCSPGTGSQMWHGLLKLMCRVHKRHIQQRKMVPRHCSSMLIDTDKSHQAQPDLGQWMKDFRSTSGKGDMGTNMSLLCKRRSQQDIQKVSCLLPENVGFRVDVAYWLRSWPIYLFLFPCLCSAPLDDALNVPQAVMWGSVITGCHNVQGELTSFKKRTL